MTTKLGVADSNGVPLAIGDELKMTVEINNDLHGSFAVYKIENRGGFPVLSYQYSKKGQIFPPGYMLSFLSDYYDHKTLLWLNPEHYARPHAAKFYKINPTEQF